METTCSIEACDRPVLARTWCRRHYDRWTRWGDPLGGQAGRALPPGEAFRARYQIEPSGCWKWTGKRVVNGRYGEFGVAGVVNRGRAHRWSYEHFVGPIPDGTEIDHLCRNTLCVNPAHLEPVTHQVNVARGESPPAQHARKTHCPQGHPYDVFTDRQRKCRACMREISRKWYAANRGTGEGTGARQREKTHCPQGHEYSPENTYLHPKTGGRNCKICRAEARRASYHRVKSRATG